MDESRIRLYALRDPALPALPTLLGREAREVLQAALEEAMAQGAVPAGTVLHGWHPQQVLWHPERALTVVYDVRLRDGAGQSLHDLVVASTGAGMPSGALRLEQAGQQVALWTAANDPRLPGLAVALHPQRLRALLAALGLRAARILPRLRSYRPGSRAVVEVQADDQRLYIKVVSPQQVAALQRRHALLSRHLPTPRSHGWSAEHGLVTLEAMPGFTLRQALSDPAAALPAPAVIADLLQQLPDTEDQRPAPDPAAMLRTASTLLEHVLPELAPRLERLVQGLLAPGTTGPRQPVHGDLHDGQITVVEGRITGLLDVDTVGLGHRVDDWGNLAGHLATRMEGTGGIARARIQEYGRQVAALADGLVDPATFRRRAAGVALALATGPFRVLTSDWPAETRRRVALAERWLESARNVAAPRMERRTSATGRSTSPAAATATAVALEGGG
ncbi:MAG: hypothetical protein ACOX2L_00270 [Anaerolineae bacterium]|jgi:hypothetical protein|nr:hypothetical protein [Chloroflexota bacterium]